MKRTMTNKEYIKEIYDPNHNDYPEVLTLDESSYFENFKTFSGAEDNCRAAIKFAKKVRGIVYTQVDGDDGSVVYDRGFHVVNRTGVYAVAWKQRAGSPRGAGGSRSFSDPRHKSNPKRSPGPGAGMKR